MALHLVAAPKLNENKGLQRAITKEGQEFDKVGLGGKKGGAARAAALTPEQRYEIAKTAAGARWKKG